MKKILTVVGARPQFIKAAVVSREIKSHWGEEISEQILHTGQHYDAAMSDVFFREMAIPDPAHSLGIGGKSHGAMTGQMIEKIEQVLLNEKPDWVLVYGDTNSTLAGAIAASKLHIPVAHVEAGLRSFNRRMPEEINRVLTDHTASLLFAPTPTGLANLLREGIDPAKIFRVGDVMLDASRFYADLATQQSKILDTVDVRSKEYVLSTIHRQENTDSATAMQVITEVLSRLAKQITVVLPLHPRTRGVLDQMGLLARLKHPDIRIVDPLGYIDMVMLEQHAKLILTDSGGVQKEAYFYAVPCVTLRHETEWVELVEIGVNELAPPVDPHQVMSAVLRGLQRDRAATPTGIYGDGQAGRKIVQQILNT